MEEGGGQRRGARGGRVSRRRRSAHAGEPEGGRARGQKTNGEPPIACICPAQIPRANIARRHLHLGSVHLRLRLGRLALRVGRRRLGSCEGGVCGGEIALGRLELRALALVDLDQPLALLGALTLALLEPRHLRLGRAKLARQPRSVRRRRISRLIHCRSLGGHLAGVCNGLLVLLDQRRLPPVKLVKLTLPVDTLSHLRRLSRLQLVHHSGEHLLGTARKGLRISQKVGALRRRELQRGIGC